MPGEETKIALSVEQYLKGLQFEVYREVGLGVGQKRADLVAKLGPVIWVVECKTTCSLQLLAQANEWRGKAHLVSIAAPPAARNKRDVVRNITRALGVGILEVTYDYTDAAAVREALSPAFGHNIRFPWHRFLNDAQKTFCDPGVVSGAWSPFKETVRLLEAVVLRSPGITMKEAVSELRGKHHYKTESTAVKVLPVWIRAGKIKNITIEKQGNKLCLYHRSQSLL